MKTGFRAPEPPASGVVSGDLGAKSSLLLGSLVIITLCRDSRLPGVCHSQGGAD